MPYYSRKSTTIKFDEIEEKESVLIAGAGRFGQITYRVLRANDIHFVVLDQDFNRVETVINYGMKCYFSDATRAEILEIAGLKDASIKVIAVDQPESALELVRYVRYVQPQIKIFARAF